RTRASRSTHPDARGTRGAPQSAARRAWRWSPARSRDRGRWRGGRAARSAPAPEARGRPARRAAGRRARPRRGGRSQSGENGTRDPCGWALADVLRQRGRRELERLDLSHIAERLARAAVHRKREDAGVADLDDRLALDDVRFV